MQIKDDVKSVFRELAPIIAGFKLAIVVIGWFGFGSIASWIITHWYPFTRRVWDYLTFIFSIPPFPIIVKDSLTAFVFFLPIGLNAFFRRAHPDGANTIDRSLGAFFGIAFLCIICWDVLSAIIDAAASAEVSNSSYLKEIIDFAENSRAFLFWPSAIFSIIYTGALVFMLYSRKYRRNIFDSVFLMVREGAIRTIRIAIILIFFLISLTGVLTFFSTRVFEMDLILSILILLLIFIFLLAAIAYAPKKLFLATGAAVAFILSAICFELVVSLINFIESGT